MTTDPLDHVRTIDPAILTDVVRQDQEDPRLEVVDWTATSLSSQGVMNPNGLVLVSGRARSGQGLRPWSVVLKALRMPPSPHEPSGTWYWRREVDVAESGLLAALPGPVAAPRFYGTTEREGGVWLWMEHVHDAAAGAWELARYGFAARRLGALNGSYLTGTPLPSEPWLTRGLARQWAEAFGPERAWEHPLVERYFSPSLRARVMRLWRDRERFLGVLDELPQVFSHFDAQRRNLLVRRRPESGDDEIVAIDWAMCGTGAVGGDLYSLVAGSALLFEWDPTGVRDLDAATFAPYVAGLRDAGWHGDGELARLGFTAWVALQWGVVLPAGTAHWCADGRRSEVRAQFGRSLEEAAAGWAALCEYCLDRADEARALMGA